MGQSKSLASADVVLWVNGAILGIATGGSYVKNTQIRRSRAIDSLKTYELVPTEVSCSGRFQVVRLHGTGGLEGQGVTAFPDETLLQRYATLTLIDRRNDQIVDQFEQCMFSVVQWHVINRQLVQGTFQFEGIGWNNESST